MSQEKAARVSRVGNECHWFCVAFPPSHPLSHPGDYPWTQHVDADSTLQYSYGYGGTRNRIGTVRIWPYTVYGMVLNPT